MRLMKLIKETFRNVEEIAVLYIYIGLQFTVGLLVVAIIITLLEGRFGDYMFMMTCARGAREAALTTGELSLVAALICDVAIKDMKRRQ